MLFRKIKKASVAGVRDGTRELAESRWCGALQATGRSRDSWGLLCGKDDV